MKEEKPNFSITQIRKVHLFNQIMIDLKEKNLPSLSKIDEFPASRCPGGPLNPRGPLGPDGPLFPGGPV